MDDLDRKILSLLAHNARMPVKEIAEHVSLTSPAVSSRIHKLEADGVMRIPSALKTLPRAAGKAFGRTASRVRSAVPGLFVTVRTLWARLLALPGKVCQSCFYREARSSLR